MFTKLFLKKHYMNKMWVALTDVFLSNSYGLFRNYLEVGFTQFLAKNKKSFDWHTSILAPKIVFASYLSSR